ncbi:hypothetical protein IMSAGC020_00525 [Lachnospiraceae bacterium]|nr:hypothetical protein IMSAGC020_00525 [Lachnospiraceae bacterium]
MKAERKKVLEIAGGVPGKYKWNAGERWSGRHAE